VKIETEVLWAKFGIADQLGLERFVAGGVSLGCATALYAALVAPQRISALILGTPPTAWETRAAQAALYEQMAALVEARGTAALLPNAQAHIAHSVSDLEMWPQLMRTFLMSLGGREP
jgi:pimeloyl-ACP methyl ester carboxylesterase